MPELFIGPEQEHLVLLDGASQSASKLMAYERRRAIGLIEEVASVQHVVAHILKNAPVELVGSRGGHNRDLTSGPFAILGAVGVGEDVEFPHRFHAEQLPARSVWCNELAGCGPANPVDPVDGIPVGFRPLPCE